MNKKTTDSSNGAKSANGSKAKPATANRSKTGKAAADKNVEKRKALLLASFQAAYESHQKTLKND